VLDRFRKSQRWLTAIFIFAIGIVFVFFLGLDGAVPGGGPGSSLGDEAVVRLDDDRIRIADYQRVREQQQQRMIERLGDQFDPDSLASFLDSQALQSVVNQMVLSQSAMELGLVASAEEVKDLLRNDPGLRDAEGRFDQANFDADIKWRYGSQANFLSAMQRDLLQQKMFELLLTQAYVSDAEALSAARYKAQEVQIAYVALDASNLPAARQPGDAEAQAYFDANREALQTSYDAETERFEFPDEIRLRHILIKPNPDGPDEVGATYRERAQHVIARLRRGEDFSEVAEEVSNDSSSNQNGGELGTVGRGDLSPALDSVVFDLPVGLPSEIIEGREGLHIVQVDEKFEARKLAFEEAGLILAAERAEEEAVSKLAQDLSAAIKGGQSLEDAARAADLSLDRTGYFTRRRDGFIPGLARPSLDIISTAFILELQSPSSPTVFDVGEQKVLIQLLERQEPDESTLADTVALTKEQLTRERQNALIERWINNRREELESTQRLQINAALVARN